jgi:predicted MFS family arabinose efflux permease
MDVVVDGLMVIMSRKDPNFGSEDLQTFSWVMYGVGGVTGALLGGEITNNLNSHDAFYVLSVFGFLISIVALTMNKSLEESNEEIIQMSFIGRASKVFREVWKGF